MNSRSFLNIYLSLVLLAGIFTLPLVFIKSDAQAHSAKIMDVSTQRDSEQVYGGDAALKAASLPSPCGLSVVGCEDETVEGRIRLAAREYGVNEETAVRIAKCESSLNPKAAHPISTAKGLFMFTDPTWKWIGAKGSQFDEAESIKQFMINYPLRPWWWECT